MVGARRRGKSVSRSLPIGAAKGIGGTGGLLLRPFVNRLAESLQLADLDIPRRMPLLCGLDQVVRMDGVLDGSADALGDRARLLGCIRPQVFDGLEFHRNAD
jgi:hypothetical protein